MITTDLIESKRELLLEQIENYERSGHFTEKEMNRLCAPIRLELEFLNYCGTVSNTNESFEDFVTACRSMGQTGIDIKVIDAEILTPNKTQA